MCFESHPTCPGAPKNYCCHNAKTTPVWLEDPTAIENPSLWVQLWVKLASAISKDPVSRGVVMYDLVNEPDNKKIFWNAKDGRPSLAKVGD